MGLEHIHQPTLEVVHLLRCVNFHGQDGHLDGALCIADNLIGAEKQYGQTNERGDEFSISIHLGCPPYGAVRKEICKN